MKDKEISNIGNQIINLEKDIHTIGTDRNNIIFQIENLTANMTIEDMIAVDEYIMTNLK